jgi:VIT1/CCC1 family predicted Fe2+/Mn2+ transporter
MTYNTHSGNERAYIRDIILGINDGLISTLLLTIGIYASGFSITAIILTIISSSIGGMISMGLGEYLATKSQAEVTKAELEMEKEHIKEHLDVELAQVKDFLNKEMFITNEYLINDFVNECKNNNEGLLNFMKRIEFGISDDDQRTPIMAMFVSSVLYFFGALPTLFSFIVNNNIKFCFYLAIILNILTLFSIGVVKTLITKTNPIYSGLENLLYGIIGGSISYGIGYLFSTYLI